MFFVRLAFWLTLVIAFIPVPKDELSGEQQPVSVGQTVNLGRAVIADFMGFCQRNPNACATGSNLASQMGLKAKSGAKMLYETLDEQISN